MNPHLARCLSIIEQSTAGVSADRARERVDGRWSISEIVEHLDRTYSGTAKGFERCLEAGQPLAKNFALTSRFKAFVVVTLGRFPEGIQAPKHVVPGGVIDLETAIGNARRDLEWLDRTATRARDRFGNGKVLDHPILGAFTVEQWLRFHVIHCRHHEKQIRERAARAVGGVR